MTEKSRKNPQKDRGSLLRSFLIRTFGTFFRATVGTGIAPVQRLRARGLYHRYGISPNPKDLVCLVYDFEKCRVREAHGIFKRS